LLVRKDEREERRLQVLEENRAREWEWEAWRIRTNADHFARQGDNLYIERETPDEANFNTK